MPKNKVLNSEVYMILSCAPLNISDNEGITPLHIALEHNYTELVKYLFEHGTDINSKSNCGRTAFHLAVINNNKEFINFILSNGGDINA